MRRSSKWKNISKSHFKGQLSCNSQPNIGGLLPAKASLAKTSDIVGADHKACERILEVARRGHTVSIAGSRSPSGNVRSAVDRAKKSVKKQATCRAHVDFEALKPSDAQLLVDLAIVAFDKKSAMTLAVCRLLAGTAQSFRGEKDVTFKKFCARMKDLEAVSQVKGNAYYMAYLATLPVDTREAFHLAVANKAVEVARVEEKMAERSRIAAKRKKQRVVRKNAHRHKSADKSAPNSVAHAKSERLIERVKGTDYDIFKCVNEAGRTLYEVRNRKAVDGCGLEGLEVHLELRTYNTLGEARVAAASPVA